MVPPEPGLSPRCGAAVYQGAPFCIRCGQAPVWHSASRRHQRGVLATVFGSLARLNHLDPDRGARLRVYRALCIGHLRSVGNHGRTRTGLCMGAIGPSRRVHRAA
jgi:hypothetical protein